MTRDWNPSFYGHQQDGFPAFTALLASPTRMRAPDDYEELMKEIEQIYKEVREEIDKELPGFAQREPNKHGQEVHKRARERMAGKWRNVSPEGKVYISRDGKKYYWVPREVKGIPESIRSKVDPTTPYAKPDVVIWKEDAPPAGSEITKGMAQKVGDAKPKGNMPNEQFDRYQRIFGVDPETLTYRLMVIGVVGTVLSAIGMYGTVGSFVEGDDPTKTPIGRYLTAIQNLQPHSTETAGHEILGILAQANNARAMLAFMALQEFVKGEVAAARKALDQRKNYQPKESPGGKSVEPSVPHKTATLPTAPKPDPERLRELQNQRDEILYNMWRHKRIIDMILNLYKTREEMSKYWQEVYDWRKEAYDSSVENLKVFDGLIQKESEKYQIP